MSKAELDRLFDLGLIGFETYFMEYAHESLLDDSNFARLEVQSTSMGSYTYLVSMEGGVLPINEPGDTNKIKRLDAIDIAQMGAQMHDKKFVWINWIGSGCVVGQGNDQYFLVHDPNMPTFKFKEKKVNESNEPTESMTEEELDRLRDLNLISPKAWLEKYFELGYLGPDNLCTYNANLEFKDPRERDNYNGYIFLILPGKVIKVEVPITSGHDDRMNVLIKKAKELDLKIMLTSLGALMLDLTKVDPIAINFYDLHWEKVNALEILQKILSQYDKENLSERLEQNEAVTEESLDRLRDLGLISYFERFRQYVINDLISPRNFMIYSVQLQRHPRSREKNPPNKPSEIYHEDLSKPTSSLDLCGFYYPIKNDMVVSPQSMGVTEIYYEIPSDWNLFDRLEFLDKKAAENGLKFVVSILRNMFYEVDRNEEHHLTNAEHDRMSEYITQIKKSCPINESNQGNENVTNEEIDRLKGLGLIDLMTKFRTYERNGWLTPENHATFSIGRANDRRVIYDKQTNTHHTEVDNSYYMQIDRSDLPPVKFKVPNPGSFDAPNTKWIKVVGQKVRDLGIKFLYDTIDDVLYDTDDFTSVEVDFNPFFSLDLD